MKDRAKYLKAVLCYFRSAKSTESALRNSLEVRKEWLKEVIGQLETMGQKAKSAGELAIVLTALKQIRRSILIT